ncbi:hypothetical protein HYW74_00945 [Candidatus Pacearchaeota archaeon]|nr:hypothetical protein [Candidatus Pacearchaeota archaeon]
MGVHTVYLPTAVKGSVLEQACVKAADELGYKTISEDKYDKDYQLGSVQELKNYRGTDIKIRGKRKGLLSFLHYQLLEVCNIKRDETGKSFLISTGYFGGDVSESKLQEYLNAVSRRLPEAEQEASLKEIKFIQRHGTARS